MLLSLLLLHEMEVRPLAQMQHLRLVLQPMKVWMMPVGGRRRLLGVSGIGRVARIQRRRAGSPIGGGATQLLGNDGGLRLGEGRRRRRGCTSGGVHSTGGGQGAIVLGERLVSGAGKVEQLRAEATPGRAQVGSHDALTKAGVDAVVPHQAKHVMHNALGGESVSTAGCGQFA